VIDELLGPPDADWDYLFGGLVLGRAVEAATAHAPDGRRMHSLHAYFLRPVRATSPVDYRIVPLREGRSFATHRLDASQDGKDVFTMTCSYTADTDGYDYDVLRATPLPPRDESTAEPGPGPWESVRLGPTPPDEHGVRASTHRHWFRIPYRLPDDAHVHAALLAFASDWTDLGARPLQLEGDTNGIVSLDHAVWFHRPARADQWLFFDVQSLVNAGGRGLLRAVMRDENGNVVASVAQELLLAVV